MPVQDPNQLPPEITALSPSKTVLPLDAPPTQLDSDQHQIINKLTSIDDTLKEILFQLELGGK